MKVLFFPLLAFMLTVIFTQHLFAQDSDIADTWSGSAEVMGTELGIVFHIKKEENTYSATMDSPDQEVYDIGVDNVQFEEGVLDISVKSIGLTYQGTYNPAEDVFEGTITQRGMKIPLTLDRGPYQAKEYKRPQTPQAPFPYTEIEVKIPHKNADLTLAGTLTLPKEASKPPVVILISGSGAQDRNSEILKHKSFWVIADFLSRQGIAVLRYDERGVGESTGSFQGATSEDFAEDVKAAVAFLKKRKDVDKKHIFLIGHSEGGVVAPMVATSSKDIAGIILLAAPGVGGDQLLIKQNEDLRLAQGMPEEEVKQVGKLMEGMLKIVKEEEELNSLGQKLHAYTTEAIEKLPASELEAIGENKNAYIQTQIMAYSSKWMRFFIKHDPAAVLRQVRCPVLAVNGEKDLQVASDINLKAIEQALAEGGNQQLKLVSYPDLNHLFQHCETGIPAEYISIEETFAQEVMEEMKTWILSIKNDK